VTIEVIKQNAMQQPCDYSRGTYSKGIKEFLSTHMKKQRS